MWLATPTGFYSAVEDWQDDDYVYVRSRSRADIDALRALAPHPLEDIYTPDNDYPWRVHVTKQVWATMVAAAAVGIDYGNFKDTVKERKSKMRATTYARVWGTLLDIESEDDAEIFDRQHPF